MESELRLRSYQQRLIDKARADLPKNRRIILYAPQGSGKSVIIAFMSHHSAKKGNKVLILSHRQEILKQNFKKMTSLGTSVHLVDASVKKYSETDVCCAMTQTISSRCKNFPSWAEWVGKMDVIIIDEAHRGEHDVMFSYFNPNAFVIGLSASILRSGNMAQLGAFYQGIVGEVVATELISLGFLTPSRNFAFQAPKLDGVECSRSTGDYVQNQLQKQFRKKERYAGIIENYNKICPGTKTIVFTTGTGHCIDLCVEFNNAGIPAKYLVSESPDPKYFDQYSGKREDVLASFEKGEFPVLVNISILDTGYDSPDLGGVILDFSTTSYTKYSQAVGRPSRVHPKKKFFYVLDFGANINSFGIYEDKPLMSLWHKSGGAGIQPTKECPTQKKDPSGRIGCGRLIPISMSDCPFCGFHFQTDKEIYTVELQEIIAAQKEEEMTIAEWCAHKKLAGWAINRIFCAVMMKNKENMKSAFEEARKVLRTEKGEMVSPMYYHYLKKHFIKKKA